MNDCDWNAILGVLANSSVVLAAAYFSFQLVLRFYRRCAKNRLFSRLIKALHQRDEVTADRLVRARCDCADRLINHQFSFANIGIVVRCASCRKSCGIVQHLDVQDRLKEWNKVSCYYQERYWKSQLEG